MTGDAVTFGLPKAIGVNAGEIDTLTFLLLLGVVLSIIGDTVELGDKTGDKILAPISICDTDGDTLVSPMDICSLVTLSLTPLSPNMPAPTVVITVVASSTSRTDNFLPIPFNNSGKLFSGR